MDRVGCPRRRHEGRPPEVTLWPAFVGGTSPPGLNLGVEISCRVCMPKRPRESPLLRLVEQHLEYLRESFTIPS